MLGEILIATMIALEPLPMDYTSDSQVEEVKPSVMWTEEGDYAELNSQPSDAVSLGTFRITSYCYACNTPPYSTTTASGRWLPGYSVASSDLPLGTIIWIDGMEYRVDDTGCPSGTIDILRAGGEDGCICELNYEVEYKEIFTNE